jgi:hypothetical protein
MSKPIFFGRLDFLELMSAISSLDGDHERSTWLLSFSSALAKNLVGLNDLADQILVEAQNSRMAESKRKEAFRAQFVPRTDTEVPRTDTVIQTVTVTVPVSNTEIHKEKDTTCPKRKFEKPSMDILVFEFEAKRSNREEADRFYHFYESKGWMVGKNKMVSWRSAVVNWLSAKTKQARPDCMQEIKRVDALMRKKYGIETTGEDHPRATEPMLCAPAFSPEIGDFECGDSDNWERMH